MTDRLKSFKEMVVWLKSVTLVKQFYPLTRPFPADKHPGCLRWQPVSCGRARKQGSPNGRAENQVNGRTQTQWLTSV